MDPVKFVVDRVALGQCFLLLRNVISCIIPPTLLLSEGQAGEVLKRSVKAVVFWISGSTGHQNAFMLLLLLLLYASRS
jgi:hypothetical protein